eukprot:3353836-Amphidinium_carterae.1
MTLESSNASLAFVAAMGAKPLREGHVAPAGSEASSVAPSPPSGYRSNVDPEAWRSWLLT